MGTGLSTLDNKHSGRNFSVTVEVQDIAVKVAGSDERRAGVLTILYWPDARLLEHHSVHEVVERWAASPLSEVLRRYSEFLDLFGNFRGFVEFFLLQVIVTDDFQSVRLFSAFNDLQSSPLRRVKKLIRP